jgi:hypothetical protein
MAAARPCKKKSFFGKDKIVGQTEAYTQKHSPNKIVQDKRQAQAENDGNEDFFKEGLELRRQSG